MAAVKSRGLGKGLEALFSDITINTKDSHEIQQNVINENEISFIEINDIKPNSKQPRKTFDDEKTEDLAKSIEVHGVIQPIIVRPIKAGGYEIVAGERRYRAARKIALKTVPCIVRDFDDEQNMLISIIENMQREDLNPIEEAEALQQLATTYALTQEEISRSVGKSRPYITNAIRLLKLPDKIKEFVLKGQLSNGHARALLGEKNEKRQFELAEYAVKEKISVRELEKLVGEPEEDEPLKKRAKARERVKSKEIKQIEEELKTALGTKVQINHKGKSGKIELDYYSREELERLIEILLTLKYS